MLRKLSLSIISLFLLTSCVTTNPQPITTVVKATPAPQLEQLEPLALDDVATILTIAVKDIYAQGYTPEFLNEHEGYIWARAKDGEMKLYPLKSLIEKYREGKQANNIKEKEKK